MLLGHKINGGMFPSAALQGMEKAFEIHTLKYAFSHALLEVTTAISLKWELSGYSGRMVVQCPRLP